MTEKQRVKFYSINDMSVGFHKKRIEKLLDTRNIENISNVNDLLEIVNVKAFFDNGIVFNDWTETIISDYKEKLRIYQSVVGRFCSKIDSRTICQMFENVDNIYVNDFWALISKYKVYERIDDGTFEELMEKPQFRITDVLQQEKLVKRFGKQIKNYFYLHDESLKIILAYFLEERVGNEECYLPKELEEPDIEALTSRYIDWVGASMNYLCLIYQAPASFPISEKTKLKARRLYEKKGKEIAKDGVSFFYGVYISYGPYEEVSNIRFNNGDIECEYSVDWIKNNLDYPTLLNNFIFVFNFVDLQFRCLHVGRKNQLGIFESVFNVKGKQQYITGTAFEQLQMLAGAQMKAYYDQLERNGVYIEDIIEWFFSIYLYKEFNMDGFRFNKPSTESTYLEKCRTIAAEIDSILHQYRLWCEDDVIDQELLEFSSSPVLINQIPSKLNDKYVYPTDKVQDLMNIICSEQSMLGYVEGYDESGDNFYEIVMKNEVDIDSFKSYQKPLLDILRNNNLIEFVKGVVVPQRNKMWILKELYYNDVLSCKYLHRFNQDLNELLEQGLIRTESSLLSKPEMDYYNYLLNKREFCNGLDIRNRYVHGNQKNDEKQNEEDYFIMLRILILIIIKINEEMCLLVDKGRNEK